MTLIMGAGPGAALPVRLGALNGGGAGVGAAGRRVTFTELHSQVADWTWTGFWTRHWNTQNKLESLASQALGILASEEGIPVGTNLEHVRKVFKEIASLMKRDGDVKTLQQCQTEYETHKAAIGVLERQRQTYTNNRMAFKEQLPPPGDDVFVKSDALKAIDEAIAEREAALNELSWEVIQSLCVNAGGGAPYASIAKINGLWMKTKTLYYQINGTPEILPRGGNPGTARKTGLVDKLTNLKTSTGFEAIKRERNETSIKKKIKDTVTQKYGVPTVLGFFAPEIIGWGGWFFGVKTPEDAMLTLAARAVCVAGAQLGVYFFTEDF